MMGARKEIEVKLPFASPSSARERIAQLGAVEIQSRQFEDNILFDRALDSLKPAGRTLRLRQSGARTLLTLKSPVAGTGRHKVREERETIVDDAHEMQAILQELGFSPSWRYQKHRTVFDLDGLQICLDETPLGCFVELEGRPEDIDRVAALLGFTPQQYVRHSYRELHERAARERGEEPSDCLLVEGAEPWETRA